MEVCTRAQQQHFKLNAIKESGKTAKLRMKVSKNAGKQEAFKVCVQSAQCVCVCALAQSAVWAVLKSALRVQESPWPDARN